MIGEHYITVQSLIDKPIIIIGCNRSGTTLLFNNLSIHPMAWSLYVESQNIYYRYYPIDPIKGDEIKESVSLQTDMDINRYLYHNAHNKEYFKDSFGFKYISGKLLRRSIGKIYKKKPIRLVEKTPANCFRIPLLTNLFPNAKFIFLIRRGEDVISSLMEGWKIWSKTGNKPWIYSKWHYIVPPGWQQWKHRTLQEICAFQWVESNRIAWRDLNRFCKDDFLFMRHEDIMSNPKEAYAKILEYCELPSSNYFSLQINNIKRRIFTTGGSTPRKGKWYDLHCKEIESVRHMFQPLSNQFYINNKKE